MSSQLVLTSKQRGVNMDITKELTDECLLTPEWPQPTGGRGEWSNNFDLAEFDYADYDAFEYRDNIHSHPIYRREKGWLYHCFRDRKGFMCIEFLNPDPNGFHCQSIPYRFDWMKDEKFVRTNQQ